MKTIYKLLIKTGILCSLILVSCTESGVDPLFDQSVNERTEALKAEYSSVLTAPENGWIGYYSPNKDFGAYTMLMDFDTDGSVKINSDYLAGTLDNSITYRIDKTLKIEMVLESASVFSAIFALYDNNNSGEYVFNILSATAEEIVLESKLDYGDDVTIFKLYPATPANLDLSNIVTSLDNIAGDGTESVFRNVLFNDGVIATFNFNATTRLTTVTYIKDGVQVSVSGPIAITANGFYFIKPIDVNGVKLTSFVYNSTTNEFENTAEKLRIIYDDIPGLPLNPYALGVDNGNIRLMRSNSTTIASDASSKTFISFYDQWLAYFKSKEGGRTISRVYIRDLNTSLPYLHVYYFSGTSEFTIYFDLSAVVSETAQGDKIVKFKEINVATNSTRRTGVTPLLDYLSRTEGFYIQKMDPINGSQNTMGLIAVDDTSSLSNWYGF